MTDEELIKLLRAYAELTDDIGLSDSAANRLESLRKQFAECKARIDALMLEYCPDEMTPEQIKEWGRNQRPVSD